MKKVIYDESTIKSLDWIDHIRTRPGMYIGKLGSGLNADDGIYVLIKEVIDNSIDEYVMGHGKKILFSVNNDRISIRDYGRGIPLGKIIDCVSKINTGGKYDTEAFKKSVGLNGVGLKAVNALSESFSVESFRDNKSKAADFSRGKFISETDIVDSSEKDGTRITFCPDSKIFIDYKIIDSIVEDRMWNYAFLNSGLSLEYNGKKYKSKNGLLDLLDKKMLDRRKDYQIIHLASDDIELAFTHGSQINEDYLTYVNGQYTSQGGTHLSAFKEAYVRTIREHFKKNYTPADIRMSLVAALSIKIQNPIFESQTKTKLGSNSMEDGGATVRAFIMDFIKNKLDAYLHKNPSVAKVLQKKIIQSEKERKDFEVIKKLSKKKNKKSNLHNKKLRDCRIHYNDKKGKNEDKTKTEIFITEGDSASGSITKSRDAKFQAVFSLRGKPLNSFGMKRRIVYENEEFNLLQHALNIEDGLEGLRYNRIIIATDADVDGMHIRLLLLTFFLEFFPNLVIKNHIFILETPLFRVRNKKETIYCYSESEKGVAIKKLGKNYEVTRFKGLGEISPNEFGAFIGDDIKLTRVSSHDTISNNDLLEFYMGKNTLERQKFIMNNLRDDV